MNCLNGFDLSLIETMINLCKDEEQSKAKYEKEFAKYKKLAPGKNYPKTSDTSNNRCFF